jgi:hypothetical protein
MIQYVNANVNNGNLETSLHARYTLVSKGTCPHKWYVGLDLICTRSAILQLLCCLWNSASNSDISNPSAFSES